MVLLLHIQSSPSHPAALVRDVATELAWLPSPPPKGFGQVLPQFVELSQDVRSALEATSNFRQVELLRRCGQRLEELQRSYAVSSQQERRYSRTLLRIFRIFTAQKRWNL
ncbi:MAG: hypothetical protein ACO3NK_14150 [Prochlorotrichaceae cyanobacterium]